MKSISKNSNRVVIIVALIALGVFVQWGAAAGTELWTFTAPSGPSIPVTSAEWINVPYNDYVPLSLFIDVQETQDLKITFTAEVQNRVDIRVLVDDEIANPGMAQFHRSGEYDTVSFTFVMAGVSPGMHDVYVQMRNLQGQGEPDVDGYIGDRSLTVLAVPSNPVEKRALGIAYYDEGASFHMTNSPTMSDVPNMVGTFYAKEGSNLDITFSAECWVQNSADRLYLRALVDGEEASPSNVWLKDTNTSIDSRSFTFTKKGVSAGWHTVVIQWSAAGSAYMKKRSLAVYAAKPEEGLWVVTPPSGPPQTTTGLSWVNLPGLSTWIKTTQPTNLEASVSGEGSLPMWVRVLVDGAPMSPSDVMFDQGSFTGTNRFVFTGNVLSPGYHSIQVQWHSDQGTAYFADRTLSVIAWQPLPDNIGVAKDGAWYLDTNGDETFNTGDYVHSFGLPGWSSIAGDWDNNGQTEVGVYKDGAWYLDWNGDGIYNTGDKFYSFGLPTWSPVTGDWDGDGDTEIGVYKDGSWELRTGPEMVLIIPVIQYIHLDCQPGYRLPVTGIMTV